MDKIITQPMKNHSRPPKLYKCTICGHEFYWNENASWYGRLEEADGNVKPNEICCSDSCRKKSKYSGMD